MSTTEITPRVRPAIIKGVCIKKETGCGNIYVTVNFDDDSQPIEVFASMGKAGGCVSAQTEAVGRLISIAMRCHVPPQYLIKQLRGVACHKPSWESGNSEILSCIDAIGIALQEAINGRCNHAS